MIKTKKISIVYNHLNLPIKIVFENNEAKKIEYIYNAVGQKLRKSVSNPSNGGIPMQFFYLDGFQYVFNEPGTNYATKLQFSPTAEGYVKADGGTYKYVFNYTDHLGNVRVSYSDVDGNGVVGQERIMNCTITGSGKTQVETCSEYFTSSILEENNYYPFGLKHSGYNGNNGQSSYKYKYNGKEFQDDYVGGNQLNLYDYGARNYDPALRRWMNIDPLAEKSRRFSPYVYANNNPIIFIDPDGQESALAALVNASSNYSKKWEGQAQEKAVKQALEKEEMVANDDIRFRDKNGDIVATYKTDKYDDDVYLPVNVPNDGNIDLNKQLKTVNLEDVDAVGVGVTGDFTFVMGGGTAIESVYFLDGLDAGKSETFKTTRQNVGFNMGYGVYGIVGDFYNDKNLTFGDYLGRLFSVGGDWGVGSFNMFWAPKIPEKDGAGFMSMFNEYLRAWTGFNIGIGLGGGYQWSKQNTVIYKPKKK